MTALYLVAIVDPSDIVSMEDEGFSNYSLSFFFFYSIFLT
jgi:hypothetical protein